MEFKQEYDNVQEVFSTFEDDENNLLDPNCPGCLFAIEEVSNLRVHVESLSSEVSRLSTEDSKKSLQISRLSADVNRLVKEKNLSEYSKYTEILIADAISKVYQKMWKLIKKALNDLTLTLTAFIDRIDDEDFHDCDRYKSVQLDAVLSIGLTENEYKLLVNFKDIRNSKCHSSMDDKERLLDKITSRNSTCLSQTQKTVREIIVKAFKNLD